ncbi:MAG: class I SAM-dependent methyltransferase [Stellaceae bacterium]
MWAFGSGGHLSSISSSYDDIASEYYDHRRHPTCRNFTEASQGFVGRLLPHQLSGICVDIGAGRSILCKLLSSRDLKLHNCILLDSSRPMLAYSAEYVSRGARLIVADATAIPLRHGSCTLIVASLGDPYNTIAFWGEVARCLAPAGTCIFTTPSYEWTKDFRQLSPKERDRFAYFELRDGRSLYLPSWVYSVEDQIKLIESTGLCVDYSETIPGASLSAPISPKLRTASGLVASPIVGFRVVWSRAGT